MKCVKKESRTFFDILEVFKCNNCDKYNNDEYIIIGKRSINIYNINQYCNKIDLACDYIYFDKRLKRILYDFCLYKNNNILIWISINKPLELYDYFLEAFMDMGYNIHIINDNTI